MSSVETTVYLQIGQQQKWPYGGVLRRATWRRPTTQVPSTILVKLTVRIPRAAFGPFEPVAVVDIPAELVQPVVTAVATDPKE